ncbi:hypothetical protein OBBRIDRAFT_798434 [Obba rivulosa]|uniref:F-box domain-containing protein n=1 Tax=Obba rivulosa TaxID=1052685 RepID=A0A8E2AIJ5_9APHY|nr:hypothetical protein OBBRIDRAFT_798434 [Obba rivulosa]
MLPARYDSSTRSAIRSFAAAQRSTSGKHHITTSTARVPRSRQLHQALQIYDILCLVLENVTLIKRDGTRGADRSSLARAARVCKAFSEPALDVLWRVMDDFIPLVKLVVLDDFQNVACWERFHIYARRVREICYSDIPAGFRIMMDPAILVTLSHCNHGLPLLPSLQTLHWTGASPHQYDSFLTVATTLNCQVTELCVRFPTEERQAQVSKSYLDTFLERLFAQLPGLQSLQVHGPFDSSLLAPIANGDKLRILHVETGPRILCSATLHSLSQVANLSELKIELQINPDSRFRVTEFPVLRKLTLVTTCRGIPRILGALSAPKLASLVVTRLICDHGENLQDAISMICSKFGQSLRTIRLVISLISQTDGACSLISIIRPLLGIRGLKTLFLQISVRIALSNTELCAMAIAWPEIEELSIYGLRSAVNPSIDALAHLAGQCPRLRSLILPYLTSHPISMPPQVAC